MLPALVLAMAEPVHWTTSALQSAAAPASALLEVATLSQVLVRLQEAKVALHLATLVLR